MKHLFLLLFVAIASSALGQITPYSGNFNGSNNYVDLGTSAGNTGIRSIEFWFKPDVTMSPSTSATGWTLINRNDATQQNEYGVYIRGTDWNSVGFLGHLYFSMRYNGNLHEIRSNSNTWTAGTWYHVAGVIDPVSGMVLYIDGVLQSMTDPSGTFQVQVDNTSSSTLGAWAGVRHFDGEMDELRFWNRAISQTEVQNKMCQDLNPANETGLTGYWKFNEGSGTTLIDQTSNSFNGTVVNMTWVADSPCSTTSGNYVMRFDGINDYLDLGISAGNTGIRSIEFWFKPDVMMNPSTSATGWTFINRNDGSQQAEYGVYIRGTDWNAVGYLGYLHFFMRYNGNLHEVRSNSNTWTAGTWYHVAGVIDPANGMMLYIDGVPQSVTDPSGTFPVQVDNTFSSTIGVWAGVRPYEGEMDELRFWDRAISQTEIQNKMCQDLNPANETGLTGYWKFNEGSGSQVIDSSASANNGSVFQATWIVNSPCTAIGQDEISNNHPIAIYPNPSENVFFLESDYVNSRLEVFDMMGNLVLSKDIASGNAMFDLEDHAAGLYFIRLTSKENGVLLFNGKIMKNK